MQRFLADTRTLFSVEAPEELVPVEHFAGTNLSQHHFSFYGEAIELGPEFNWDVNPGTQHWGHDLNRFGFLVLYDPCRPDETWAMKALILGWIRKNGRKQYKYTPYAWQNLLNVAIRIENWWRFLDVQSRSGSSIFNATDWLEIKTSVVSQLIILLRLIDQHGYQSNWSLLGLRAALYILYSVASFPHRDRLIAIAWRGLRKAVEQQILPDGVQQELSPHYHWVALELLASIDKMAEQAGSPEQGCLRPTIDAMALYLEALILPDGGLVAFGDSDFDYGPRIRTFIDKLQGDDARHRANKEEISVFPYAGIAVMRDRDARHVLAFDAGPYGTAHQHEDALSFWLTAFGEHFLVDPGRYLYDYGRESMYSHLSSSAAHSTILVGAVGQAAKKNPAGWRRTEPGGPVVERCGNNVCLSGLYSQGYEGIRAGVAHERMIAHEMNSSSWAIHDQIMGDGDYRVEARFQFAPCSWTLEGRRITAQRGNVWLQLEFAEAWQEALVMEGADNPRSGWYSSGLNKLEAAPCLCLRARSSLPFKIMTRITASEDGFKGVKAF